MPAGGLFSTATDLSNFFRMIMNPGVRTGQRILSEQAVKQSTSRQTGDLKDAYGSGISTGGNKIAHGGAYNTNSSFDPDRGVVLIFLGQHASFRGDSGKTLIPTFRKAALYRFAPAK